MAFVVPSWFKGRQGKAEPAGDNVYRLTGPNLREAYVTIRPAGNGKFQAALRFSPDGPDEALTGPDLDSDYNAWEAAFELFRTHVVT